MQTIFFILNDISHPRCHKRIAEFINHGYKVKVFGFARKGFEMPYSNSFYTSEVLATITEGNYARRLLILRQGVHAVRAQMKDNDILYIFGLDISIACLLAGMPKYYFYEESDLTHTYIKNGIIQQILEIMNKRIIHKSLATILTSEGFAHFHFKDHIPKNVFIVPNRLNKEAITLSSRVDRKLNMGNLQIGFVGAIRYKSVFNFASCIGSKFPLHTFHFFGAINRKDSLLFEPLKVYKNIIFHGTFSNPTDLPSIYSQIDICISTYDTDYINVQYAEPNKLYECLFFNTPLVVSKDTFLAKKVERLKIGFVVDATNVDSISKFISNLTQEDIETKKQAIKQYPKKLCINDNSRFFREIADIIKNKSLK